MQIAVHVILSIFGGLILGAFLTLGLCFLLPEFGGHNAPLLWIASTVFSIWCCWWGVPRMLTDR